MSRGPLTGDTVLTALAASNATSAENAIRAVEGLTGRRIEVRALPELLNEPLCGAWVGLENKDLLFHVPTDSALSREQIIFHELGHIVLGHAGTQQLGNYVADLLSDLPHDAVISVLGRGDFQDASERAAESYADQVAAVLRDNRRGRTPFARVFS
jgi:hypothetical protein